MDMLEVADHCSIMRLEGCFGPKVPGSADCFHDIDGCRVLTRGMMEETVHCVLLK